MHVANSFAIATAARAIGRRGEKAGDVRLGSQKTYPRSFVPECCEGQRRRHVGVLPDTSSANCCARGAIASGRCRSFVYDLTVGAAP
jgi:hypothetical protein